MLQAKQKLVQKRKLESKKRREAEHSENPEERSRRRGHRHTNNEQEEEVVEEEEIVDEEPSSSSTEGGNNNNNSNATENPTVRKTRKVVRKVVKKKNGDDDNTPVSGKSQMLKIFFLILLVPSVMSIPFVLSRACVFVEEKLPKYTIEGVWCVYIPLMLFLAFYVQRGKTTITSFTTHNMIYLIFALGLFNFLHVQQSVPFRHRRMALKLWLTITMIFNLAAFLIDDTDYRAKEEKENEHEKRKEERRKKREEDRALRKKEIPLEELPFYKRNKAVKVILDVAVYAVALAVVVWLAFAVMRSYEDFNVKKAESLAESQKSWGYESNTGADWKPNVNDDDLHDVHVGETKPKKDDI